MKITVRQGALAETKADALVAGVAAGVKKQLTSGFTLGQSVVAGGMIAVLTLLGKKAVGVAGDFEQTKVAYETMLGSASKAGSVLSALTKFSTVTPFEPEWEGNVTLEISNTTPLPAKIYANEGIAQVLFFEADEDDVCEVSYADKKGKYQAQHGVTLPKL